MKNKDIETYDSIGNFHDYFESYDMYGNLWNRCKFKHGELIGYEEVNNIVFNKIGQEGTVVNYWII